MKHLTQIVKIVIIPINGRLLIKTMAIPLTKYYHLPARG